MAAQSRLALRSSHRGSVGLGELPATVIQRNPSPANTRKRTRDPPTDQDDHKLSKRLHESPETTFPHRNAIVYSRKTSTKNVAAPALNEAVTQIAARPHTPPPPPTLVQQAPHNPTIVKSAQGQTSNEPSIGTHKSLKTAKADKRSLRSHDGGSRFKSELASYFADYDEVLGGEPKMQGINQCLFLYLNDIDTGRIPDAGNPYLFALNNGEPDNQTPSLGHGLASNVNAQVNSGRTSDGFKLNNAERLDFTSAEQHARQINKDPLTDDLYLKAHRRAERGEKSHRNREKESAQHEKFQLERILEELKGHGWLKTMGISGITESEKKIYEPKRTIFIQRVTALLDKFRAWKEEEKRRKVERERASTVDEEEEEEVPELDQPDSPGGYDGVNERNGSSRAKRYGYRDAALARTGPSASSKRARLQTLDLLPLPVEKPFTSFYSKPYLRDAALSKHRRGRLRFAFGQQVPDLEERDFNLPSEMLTTKFIAANARSRRAARREGRDNQGVKED
ncbi:MAG: hypothetical protein Q9225_002651 [Loekoesia sp. 1 TL-2023]